MKRIGPSLTPEGLPQGVTTGSRNLSKHIGHSIEDVVVGMERYWSSSAWSSYQKEWAEETNESESR